MLKEVSGMSKAIFKIIKPEIKSLGDGLISAVVSTESKDRDGDIIRQANWDLKYFLEHPVLLSSHNYGSLINQIGEWKSMEIKGKKLIGVAEYYVGKGNAEADWAAFLAEKGKAAFSVGFIPDMSKAKPLEEDDDWGFGPMEFLGQQLLEVSHVTVPANPDALQQMAKQKSLHPEIKQLFVKELELMRSGKQSPIVSKDAIASISQALGLLQAGLAELQQEEADEDAEEQAEDMNGGGMSMSSKPSRAKYEDALIEKIAARIYRDVKGLLIPVPTADPATKASKENLVSDPKELAEIIRRNIHAIN